MGESLISTCMVAPGQLNQRCAATGIELDILGFRNFFFSMNTGRKRIERSEKKIERKFKFGVFLKELEEKKDVRKVLR